MGILHHPMDVQFQIPRGFPGMHNYHNSHSMHHDQIGKNVQKIQTQNLDSFVAPSVANGRGGHLMQSTTPPPMIIDG